MSENNADDTQGVIQGGYIELRPKLPGTPKDLKELILPYRSVHLFRLANEAFPLVPFLDEIGGLGSGAGL